jgi:hypothetical protein
MNGMEAGTDWFSLEGEAFVRQAYLRLLERPADAAGLQSYTAQLLSGIAKTRVLAELGNSPEGLLVARRRDRSAVAAATGTSRRANRATAADSVRELLVYQGEEFVRRAYRALLGREADALGLQHYTQRLASGETRERIIADLYGDSEGQAYGARLAGLPELLAEFALDRQRESVTVEHAADLLKLYGPAFLRTAYRSILGRDADDDGLATYLSLLRDGYSRSHVIAALAASPECVGRGSPLPGLKGLAHAYHKGQGTSWSGWYWRNVMGVESDLAPAREARRLQSSVGYR